MCHNAPKVLRRTRGLTVDDVWQIADAGDQELRRQAHSSRQGSITEIVLSHACRFLHEILATVKQ